MAKRNTPKKKRDEAEVIPPGATKQAAGRDENPRGRPRHTPLDDRHATGDSPSTGLVGAQDGDERDVEGEGLENGPPYAGHAGGSVGGTPAEGGATGGEIHGGMAPEEGTRSVESTVGSKPSAGKRRGKGK